MNSNSDDKILQNGMHNLCFKERKSFAARKEEVSLIREKYPGKIPIVVERYKKETLLPVLEKTKFLVPLDITVSQFLNILRTRLHINSHQSLFLMFQNKTVSNLTKTLAQAYADYMDDDGFLYVTYASQEAFG